MDHLHNKIVEVANLLVLLLCVLHFLCFFYNCKAGRFRTLFAALRHWRLAKKVVQCSFFCCSVF